MVAMRRRRIIPARAGFTPGRFVTTEESSDHPRSRGVYLTCGRETTTNQGSSPLARGLPADDGEIIPIRRIIPARAGFTSESSPPVAAGEDHPRSRGVYSTSQDPSMSPGGSSPLARGLRVGRAPTQGRCRIIPARAGFTNLSAKSEGHPWDHPRSRGVYLRGSLLRDRRGGSSPLARGLPPLRRVDHGASGIIPARAGFTRKVLNEKEK